MRGVPVAAKQYDVLRYFRRVDPRTGESQEFQPGDTYSGAVDEEYFLAPAGPDGQGPLLAEKSSTSGSGSGSGSSSASSSAEKSSPSSDSTGKEK
jgi:hypothetical protein